MTINGGTVPSVSMTLDAERRRQMAAIARRIARAKAEREAKAIAANAKYHAARKLVAPVTLSRLKRRGIHTFRKGNTGALGGAMTDGSIRDLGKALGVRAKTTRRWRLIPRLVWAARKALALDLAKARLLKPTYHVAKPTLFDTCQSMHGRGSMADGKQVTYHSFA